MHTEGYLEDNATEYGEEETQQTDPGVIVVLSLFKGLHKRVSHEKHSNNNESETQLNSRLRRKKHLGGHRQSKVVENYNYHHCGQEELHHLQKDQL